MGSGGSTVSVEAEESAGRRSQRRRPSGSRGGRLVAAQWMPPRDLREQVQAEPRREGGAELGRAVEQDQTLVEGALSGISRTRPR